jgi:hypothetical protein
MAQKVFLLEGSPGITRTVVSTDDTVMQVPDNAKYLDGSIPDIDDPSSKWASKMIIVVEGADIRFAFGTDPDITGGSEVGAILTDGSSVVLGSFAQITAFRYTNAVAGANATIHFYPEYRS